MCVWGANVWQPVGDIAVLVSHSGSWALCLLHTRLSPWGVSLVHPSYLFKFDFSLCVVCVYACVCVAQFHQDCIREHWWKVIYRNAWALPLYRWTQSIHSPTHAAILLPVILREEQGSANPPLPRQGAESPTLGSSRADAASSQYTTSGHVQSACLSFQAVCAHWWPQPVPAFHWGGPCLPCHCLALSVWHIWNTRKEILPRQFGHFREKNKWRFLLPVIF